MYHARFLPLETSPVNKETLGILVLVQFCTLFQEQKVKRLWGHLIAAFQCLNEPTGKTERYYLQGPGVTVLGVMASYEQRVGLDGALGKNSSL